MALEVVSRLRPEVQPEWIVRDSFQLNMLREFGYTGRVAGKSRLDQIFLVIMLFIVSVVGCKQLIFFPGPSIWIRRASRLTYLRSFFSKNKNFTISEISKNKYNAKQSVFLLELIHAGLQFNDSKEKAVLDVTRRLIILAPGSGLTEKHKRWPSQYFSSLAVELVNLGFAVSVVFGPGEEDIQSMFWEGVTINEKQRITQHSSLNPSELVTVIRHGGLVVAGCNGLSHLASLLGIPVIGLYGPTEPSLTGVCGPLSRWVVTPLGCRGCYSPTYMRGCANPTCMDSIGVSEVVSEVKEIFNV